MLIMVLSAVMFGLMPSLASIARSGGVSTETLLFIRFSISAVLVAIFARATRRPMPTGVHLARWMIVGLVLYTVQSYSFFTALLHAPAALVSLLLYLYPVIVAVLSVMFLGEKITKLKGVCLTIAIAGAILAVGPVAAGSPLGVIWGLTAAIAYSVYLVVGARLLRDSDAVGASVVIMFAASIAYATMATLNGWHFPETTGGWAGSIGLALVSAVALATLFVGMDVIGPVNTSTISAIEPIVTAALGFALFAQKPTPLQFVGGALILAAALLVVRGSHTESDVKSP